ncbi:MAG: ABC transporter permease [Candidatus Hermodarchaeota archaeon]
MSRINLRNWRCDKINRRESQDKKRSFNLKNGLLRLLKQIKKEFRLLWTDKFNMFIALIVPPLVIVALGLTSGNPRATIQPINCVVVSYDSNAFIEENNFTESTLDDYNLKYVEAVNDSNLLNLVQFFNATEELYAMEMARNLLTAKQIKVIISIPVDFSELIEWGYPGLIDCVTDSSDIQKIQASLNAVYDSIKIFVFQNNLSPQFKIKGYEEFSIPEGYSFSYNYMIVLVLSFMIIGVGMVSTILIVVQEKPVARLLLTPVKRLEILTAKYLTYISILIIQNLSLISTALAFGLYLVGSVIDLFLALFILGFTGLTLGIFISAVSKTKTQANQLFLATFLVLILLSGIFIPIDAMPIYLQVIAYILPLSHGSPLINSIITKGKSVFGFDFFTLLGVSLILVGLSYIIFHRRKYEV